MVSAEARDVEWRIDELVVPDGRRAIVFDPPDSPGRPVAVDISAEEFVQTTSAIDAAARE